MKELLENNIVNLVQSIKKYYNIENEHNTIESLDGLLNDKKPKHVVFLCLDGLGYDMLNNSNFLEKNLYKKIDTVFPCTTASATISLQTGLYPCEHGWIGWAQYFKEFNDVIELFSGYGFYSKKKYDVNDITKDISFTPFYNLIENSKIFFPDFVENGYKTFDDMTNDIVKHIYSSKKSFSYAYWTEPDHLLHENGKNDVIVKNEINRLGNLLEDMCEKLDDTIIIVTADHGHKECQEIVLNNYPIIKECLSQNPSIEPRCVNFFVKENKEKIFLKEINQFLNYFDIYTKEEFINTKFFNKGKINNKIYEFIGYYILIAKDKYMISLNETSIKSMHCGSTKEEMEVPLVIICK